MKPRPTPTGLAALEQAPMSQAEIADLVVRVRRNMRGTEDLRHRFTTETARVARQRRENLRAQYRIERRRGAR